MKLLLVAATQAELKAVFSYFGLPDGSFVQHAQFDILITGVGIHATAFSLGKFLNNNYNLVLNVGIAGSFNKKLKLGQLVNICSDTFADLGAENHEEFLSITDLGFGKSTYNMCYEHNEKLVEQLNKVKGITVNKVHGNEQSIAHSLKRFSPETESMEGAAVFYACEKYNLPCLQIRSISNYVEPRNRENWQIELAINNLNEWVIDFIKFKIAK